MTNLELDLCLALVHADCETDAINILKEAKHWDDRAAWTPFGNSENNFNIIGNQQASADAALVEKLINSIDAVLMAECLRTGIDPESAKAPQTVRDAVEKFFHIKDGVLSHLEVSTRNRLADRIMLVASGAKSSPSITIVDQGEGQSPKRFPDTLMSLSRGNKQRIPFVQGKFNMGGTGILRFCGQEHLQLVLSRRHPEIAARESDYSKENWGFTVVRRFPPPSGYKSSVYKYLAPFGEVLQFSQDDLPILPGPNGPYGRTMSHGTLIKLYDFDLKGYKTIITLDLNYRLSLLMAEAALPIRIIESRDYRGHTLEATLSGIKVRIDEDRSENVEEGFPASLEFRVQDSIIKVSITLFKRNQSTKYRKREGVVFLVNGQMHGAFSIDFFSRKSVSMGYLAKDLLVLVDCSNLPPLAIENLFMNSRDRLSHGDLQREIEEKLEEIINSHQGLREFHEQRKREDLEKGPEEIRALESVLQDIIRNNPALAKLFRPGNRIPNPFKVVTGNSKERFDGVMYPSFFSPKRDHLAESPKPFHMNHTRFRVQFITDANNDYFDRDNYPGTFALSGTGQDSIDYDINLWNGVATLSVTIPKSAKVGQLVEYSYGVMDITRVEPLGGTFVVKIEAPLTDGPTGGGRRKKLGGEGRGDDPSLDKLSLPNYRLVRRDDWGKHGFDADSAVRIVENGEGGFDFFINADNIHLLSECKRKNNTDSQVFELRFALGLLLMSIGLIKDRKTFETDESVSLEDFVSRVTRLVAPIILPMIESLIMVDEDSIAKVFDSDVELS